MAASFSVILKTNVHCCHCAQAICDAVKNMHGVKRVWASPETDFVIVSGTADATALQWRVYQTVGRSVTIVSDGADEARHYYYGMPQPPPEMRRLPPQYYGWWPASPPPSPYHYYAAATASPVGYVDGYRCPYGGYYSPPPRRRYASPPAAYSGYQYGELYYSCPYGDHCYSYPPYGGHHYYPYGYGCHCVTSAPCC